MQHLVNSFATGKEWRKVNILKRGVQLVTLAKLKNPVFLTYCLLIEKELMNSRLSLTALAQSETRTATSTIWTWDANSISCDDNCSAKRT